MSTWRERVVESVRRMGAAYAVLVLTVGVTLVAYVLLREDARRREQERFDVLANQTARNFRRHTDFYVAQLRGVRALFAARANVRSEHLRLYLSQSGLEQQHEGLADVGYATAVPAAAVPAHETWMRAQGAANYAVRSTVAAAPMRYPITFLDSFRETGSEAPGFDLGQEPRRLAALELARDTGKIVATAPLEVFSDLLNDTNAPSGFVIFLPVYEPGKPLESMEARRAAVRGFVFGSFVPQPLWQAVVPPADQAGFALRVYDGVDYRPERLLFDSRSLDLDADLTREAVGAHAAEVRLSDLGREWTLVMTSRPGIHATREPSAAVMALGGGLTFSALLFGITLIHGRANRRYEAITRELVETDAARKTSEENYRAIFESIQDVYYRVDLAGHFLAVSPSVERAAGYTPAELIGQPATMLYTDPAGREAVLQRLLTEGRVSDYELQLRAKGGRVLFGSVSAQLVRNELGEVIGTEGTVRDITARKQAEAALRLSETNLRQLYEAAPVMMHSIDPEGLLRDVNRKWLEITGYARDEVLGRRVDFLVATAEGQARCLEALADFWRVGEIHGLPLQFRTRAGALIEVRLDAVAITDAAGQRLGVSIVRDVTEQLRAEAALRESESLYHSLVDCLPHYVFRMDRGGRLTFANDFMCVLVGRAREDILGRTPEELWPSPMAEEFRQENHLVTSSGRICDAVKSHVLSNGQVAFFHTVKAPIRNAQGEITGVQGVFWDVTERRRAEQELASEKERLAITLRCISEGVVTTDIAGRVVLVNHAAEVLTGWGQTEACGRELTAVFQVVRQSRREQRLDPVERVLRATAVVEEADDLLLLGRGAPEREIALSAAPIRDATGQPTGVVIVFRDVTERRRLEAELLQHSKLESIGLLAGGLAHDFNNILMSVTGNLSLARIAAGAQGELLDRLNEIDQATQRARDLTLQLLTFAKGGAPIKKTATVAQLVKDSVDLTLRGTNVRCEVHLPADLPPVDVDPGQMNQVLNNLLINALQAMPGGGRIALTARSVTLGPNGPLPLPPGPYVHLTVSDEGMGIPPEHLGRVFDPYFTTKQTGSGLGLATAHSIMRRHNGWISVESTLGVGAHFHLHLPASAAPPPAPAPSAAPALLPLQGQGQGRILVMDDEPSVRRIVQLLLHKLGYETETVADGTEALAAWERARAGGRPFDLALVDLTIAGGLGGRETMERLRALDPTARALVSSGYSNDPVMAHPAAHGFCGVVEKPYRIDELAQALQRALGAHRP